MPAGQGRNPWTIAVADVDGDGKLDILALNVDSGEVSIYRNISTPGTLTANSFAAPVNIPVGSSGSAFGVRDLNGDGLPDIVVANGTTPGTITIVQNESTPGNIVFGTPVTLATGNNPSSIAIGDLDGDGYPDIAVANYSGNSVSILRNLGTGGYITTNSFATHVDIPTIASCYVVAIGDMDGDGKQDLVVGGTLGSQEVAVLRNTSTPGSITTNSFAPPVAFAAGGWVDALALGDLNGDGKLDIALVTQGTTYLSIFQNVSTPGSFTTNSLAERVDYPAYTSSSDGNGIFIGDLAGDGRPDIAMVYSFNSILSIYQNFAPFGGAPVITTQPNNVTVFEGQTATFTVDATGTSPLSYQWTWGTTNVPEATNSTLILTDVQYSQAGSYEVTVTNLYGSTNSISVTLTVNPPPPCDPAPSGLVSWWPGEGNADDIIGTNNGIANNITYSNGEVGQAFEFDGSSSYVRIPASSSLNVGAGSGLSIESWINPADVSQQRPIVEWNSGSGYGAMLWISTPISSGANGPGCLCANLPIPGANHIISSAAGLVVSNQYQHVAFTYDESSGLAVLYLNGAVVAQQNLGIVTPQTTFDLYFGYRPAESDQAYYWIGSIDEVSLYNRALSTNEIQTIYNAGSAGKCPEPPTILVQPTNQIVAAGLNATFVVTATGSTPLNYQWNFGGTNIVGATNTTLTLTNVQLTQAGVYAVTVPICMFSHQFQCDVDSGTGPEHHNAACRPNQLRGKQYDLHRGCNRLATFELPMEFQRNKHFGSHQHFAYFD